MTTSPHRLPPHELTRRELVIRGVVLSRAAEGDFPPCDCGNPLAGWHDRGEHGRIYCCAKCKAHEVRS